MLCFFVSDLHGSLDRYRSLWHAIRIERPAALLMGGDLLPHLGRLGSNLPGGHRSFVDAYLADSLTGLRREMGEGYPRVILILGNDDPRIHEAAVLDGAARGLWEYAHGRRLTLGPFSVHGYSYVPPTPFQLKDWERYDVSRFVDPGCVSPEEGRRTVRVRPADARWTTIQQDLMDLVGDEDLDRGILLLHTPPYQTRLDRAALDGMSVDHAPLDVHVGSIAVRRFIETRQPLISLHGHVHESTRLTGSWRDRIGRTHCFSAAHDGPELALVRFDPDHPKEATRTLI